jgi:hypothetical protein
LKPVARAEASAAGQGFQDPLLRRVDLMADDLFWSVCAALAQRLGQLYVLITHLCGAVTKIQSQMEDASHLLE